MQAQIEISHDVLTDAMSKSLFKGELGDKVAAHLANLYAEVTTYNRTDAAKLLNIARSTVYEYEAQNLIEFDSDGRASLAALLECRRKIAAAGADEEKKKNVGEFETEINRKSFKPKRRTLKK